MSLETRLSVRLTPRASSNAVLRYEADVLYLRLTAPPVEGAANAACCTFVAGLLGICSSQIRVSQGHKSRNKVLLISGISVEMVRERLLCALEENKFSRVKTDRKC